MSLSLYAQTVLALVPKVSGSLGFLSSCFIVSEILRDHRERSGNPIKRVIFAIAIYDMGDSLAWLLSTWMLPSTSGAPFAVGTQGSCDFQGFLLQFVISAPIMNIVLTYFFYKVVTVGHCGENIRRIEAIVHTGAATFALGSSVSILAAKQYNQVGNVCFIIGSPYGCGNSTFAGGGPPCDRGDFAYLYGLFLFYVPTWICLIIQIILNFKIRRALVKSNSSEVDWVTRQCLLYSLAFFVTWAPSTIWSILSWTGGGGFWFDLSSCLIEPLQGFWNLLIFIQNRPGSKKRLERILMGEYWEADNALDIRGTHQETLLEKSDRKYDF
jgi:hypothetical protein